MKVTPLPNARRRPLAPVRLIGFNQDSPQRLALVDSGAELSVFPYNMMKYTVANATATRTFTWRGGTVTVDIATAVIHLRGENGVSLRWTADVAFFPDALVRLPYPILGQGGCLEYLDAAFYERRQEFTLDPTLDFPGVVSFPKSTLLRRHQGASQIHPQTP